MKAQILITILSLISVVAQALEVPPATSYDSSPSQVFTADTMVDPIALVPQLDLKLKGFFATPGIKGSPEDSFFLIGPAKGTFDHSSGIEWSVIADLNDQATEVWQKLLGESQGDAKRLRENYVAHRFSPQARHALSEFHSSVAAYLGSSLVEPLLLNKITSCNGSQGACEINTEVDKTIVHFYPSAAAHGLAQFRIGRALQVEDALAPIRMHPLLIQVLLENLAVGYPINYGTTACAGIDCPVRLVFGRKMILPDDIRWGLRGFTQNYATEVKRDRQFSWVMQLLDDSSGVLPALPDNEGLDDRVLYLKRALNAARVLQHISASPLTCSDWGLWPKRTVDLVSIFSQSIYELNKHRYELTDLDMLTMRLSDACKTPYGYNLYAPGASGDAPMGLARVGAWRKLLGQW